MSRRGRLFTLAVLCLVAFAAYWLRSGQSSPAAPLDRGDTHVAPAEDGPLVGLPDVEAATSRDSKPSGADSAGTADPVQVAHSWEETADEAGSIADLPNGVVARVEDARGLPVPDAAVTLYWRRGWGDYVELKGTTDARGEIPTPLRSAFQVERLVALLEGDKAERSTSTNDLFLDLGNPRLMRFRVADRVRLQLQVRILGGGSVAGSEVEISRLSTRSLDAGLNALWSDAPEINGVVGEDGRIEFDLDARAYSISAVDQTGLYEAIHELSLVGGGEVQVAEIVLVKLEKSDPPRGPRPEEESAPRKERATLEGVVVDGATGAPIEGARLSVIKRLPKQGSGGEPRSGAGGSFSFKSTFRRDVDFVFARATGYAWAAVPLRSVPAGQPIRVAMQPAQRIEGYALDEDGAPVKGWARLYTPRERVGLGHLNAGLGDSARYLESAIESVGTGPPGKFHFNGATQAEHKIWFRPSDSTLPPGVAIARGGDMNVVISIGVLPEGLAAATGVVRDSVTGKPVPGIRVEVFGGHSSEGAVGTTDDEGRYVCTGLKPGEFNFDLGHEGEVPGRTPYAFKTRVHRLEPGSQEIDFMLPPARTLQLLLEGGSPSGPLRSARVSVLDADGVAVSLQDDAGYKQGTGETTDWNGRVDLIGVPAGEVLLQVWRSKRGKGAPDFERALDTSQPQTALKTLRF